MPTGLHGLRSERLEDNPDTTTERCDLVRADGGADLAVEATGSHRDVLQDVGPCPGEPQER